ncbi:hypothetical protein [Lactobacillus johnsonii]|uniref:Uncharacterized protein n=1 Tax=Lactobacillus johnsonii ATCC 33200 TaxID=525330 RepID=C2E7M6_LACJH|nr:hypothetical protein [Lactobacillus johnsonii]EEJ59068.1 hypothetical protein HMPREF0528_1750 [Lactobacillus johnsonii ATCC 33200]KRK55626.1 hypothetical protein FC22_GL000496 [Lactobacillus johnsonii ATCC 33200]MCF0083961.1 hypothetical protein [Lactobacillus johnsonii]MCT3322833.1 hypothetical protein [Lactobacillus johnsonii]MCT3380600.1 hypothetical protein [Lactobacillus johnsonii]
MDWKVFFKKVAIFSWCMAIISVLIYIVRYTASEIGNLFMWNQPFIWELIFGLVFCLLSVLGTKKNK